MPTSKAQEQPETTDALHDPAAACAGTQISRKTVFVNCRKGRVFKVSFNEISLDIFVFLKLCFFIYSTVRLA